MPIKVPNDLPAVETLTNENVFVMTDTRAMTQDIRPLQILILNLMPTKIDTETQLTRLLGNTPLQVELDLLQTSTHKSHVTAEEHMLVALGDAHGGVLRREHVVPRRRAREVAVDERGVALGMQMRQGPQPLHGLLGELRPLEHVQTVVPVGVVIFTKRSRILPAVSICCAAVSFPARRIAETRLLSKITSSHSSSVFIESCSFL